MKSMCLWVGNIWWMFSISRFVDPGYEAHAMFIGCLFVIIWVFIEFRWLYELAKKRSAKVLKALLEER